MSSLSTLLASAQKGFLKRILEGAGIGLGTAGVSMLLLKSAISVFQNTLNGIPVAVFQLIGLSGIDIFFSLILGAIVTKHQANLSKLFFTKK
ncbi:DUF2523 domain-containing protein [Acinetobacter qingfengensis]|uniref:Uncharacterized protein n=1 Tax=Acinetobacter qingfengensis TaxID=1262585 RepID=A0A1E7QYW2_9GAMM|nr:DUF2523 family protein [Acinetobacter qingfengensis]KAA8730779.1 DUF2523 domain-containing protein [Acinetobacter qingfengensis]OEY92262.1 hypothetical protein BJI46_05810 [Acinetobacter qingfengensis]